MNKHNLSNQPIGIIDSGIGGLSIWQEIIKLLPYENTIYLADQENFPYGTKSARTLNKIVSQKVEFLVNCHVKLIVIACNTATVHTLDNIRKKYKLPIVGTVPIIKKAAEISKSGRIGVISTSSTSRSPYQKKLIGTFASGLTVYNKALDGIVNRIENLKFTTDKILPIIEKNLVFLKKKNIDVLALGCTHYSFIKPSLEKFFGKRVLILDSAGAITRQVKRVLENNQALAPKKKIRYQFYTTGNKKSFEKQLKILLNLEIYVTKI